MTEKEIAALLTKKSVTISVRVKPEFYLRVKEEAELNNMRLGEFVLHVLRTFIYV